MQFWGDIPVIVARDRFSGSRNRWAVATALLLAGALAIPEARSEGAALAGSWVGGGIVVYPSGNRERARCQASYSGGASTVIINAICATPSGSVTQSARLRKVGADSYSGAFYNAQYGISGAIYVSVHGNSQSVSIRGGAGSASLSLRRAG